MDVIIGPWRRLSAEELMLENTLESPLDYKEIRLVNPKGNQPWIFIWKTDVEAEAPILWPPDVKNWMFLNDPDAGKDWRWEEKGRTEDEMVGWHHQLDGHDFEQTLGDGEGQGSVVCCSPWVAKNWMWLSDWTDTCIYIWKIYIKTFCSKYSFPLWLT